MEMHGFPIYEVKGLDHPLIDGVITAMIRTERGIEVTVDDRITYLFVCAVDMVPVGGKINGSKPRMKGLQELLEIQGQDGNWDHDKYMYGMYHGLALAHASMTGTEPQYRDWPYSKWQYLWKQLRQWFMFNVWFRYFHSPLAKPEGGQVNADNRPVEF